MSSRDCLVVVYPKEGIPRVVGNDKDSSGKFSKKEAQSMATILARVPGTDQHAEVVQCLMKVT